MSRKKLLFLCLYPPILPLLMITLIELTSHSLIKYNLVKIPSHKRSFIVENNPNIFNISYRKLYPHFIGFAPYPKSPNSAKIYIDQGGYQNDPINKNNYQIRPPCMDIYHQDKTYRVPWVGRKKNPFTEIVYSKIRAENIDNFDDFIAKIKHLSKNNKIIVTLGGSTTACAINWSYYLAKLKDNIAVVNLGFHGGGAKTSSQIVQSFVRDISKKTKITAIISLDGFNDIHGGVGVGGVVGKIKNQHYQDSIFKNNKMIAKFLSSDFFDESKRFLVRLFPNTLFIMINNSDIPSMPIKIGEGGVKYFEVSKAVQNQIFNNFSDSLIDLRNSARKYTKHHITYLQPIAHKKYYPINHARKSLIKDVNHALKVRTLKSNPLDYVISPDNLYEGAEEIFFKLNKKYPGSFVNLAYIFSNEERNMYFSDSIHYNRKAGPVIAKEIFRDLVRKGVVGR